MIHCVNNNIYICILHTLYIYIYIYNSIHRISFEWALIKGDTDTEETAHELGMLKYYLL